MNYILIPISPLSKLTLVAWIVTALAYLWAEDRYVSALKHKYAKARTRIHQLESELSYAETAEKPVRKKARRAAKKPSNQTL